MNKSILAASIVAGLALIGGGAYLVSQKDTTGSTNVSRSEEQKSTPGGDNPVFSPLATEDLAFEGTFTSTNKDGVITTGLIEVDGLGNSKFSGEADGSTYAAYSVDGIFYSCSSDKCIKMQTDQLSEGAISPSTYSLSDTDYENYKNNAIYKGKSACPAGTCETWEVTDLQGLKAVLFISSDNHISKVTGDTDEGKYEINFNYRDVKISAPENVTEIPTFN